MAATVTSLVDPPLKRGQPRRTTYRYEITGTRDEVLTKAAEIHRHSAAYCPMIDDPIEQPDGTWKAIGESSYSCD